MNSGRDWTERSSIFVISLKKRCGGNFLGSPVVETLPSITGNVNSIPGQGAMIPYASLPETTA